MARVLPELVEKTSTAERILIEALGPALPDDWVIIHGQRLTTPVGGTGVLRESEIDVIVIAPELGVLCIEVKGGRAVGRDGAGWYSVSEGGKRHAIKDPGRQSQASAHQLAAYLRDLPEVRLPGGCPPFAWGVCFPQVDITGALGPELDRRQIIDATDLARLRPAVERIFRCFPADRRLRPEDVPHVIDAIAPRFQLVSTLNSQVAAHETTLVRLTDEQLEVLDALEDARRVLVTGPAGTGKTMIAMERARRLARDGARVLLLCYNKLLASRLKEQVAQRAPTGARQLQPSESFKIAHFHGFCRELGEQTRSLRDLPTEPAALQQFYREEAPRLLEESLAKLPDLRFDAVIIDEAQDFAPGYWAPVRTLLADSERSYLWVFQDPMQNIYGGGVPDGLGLTPYKLRTNCRNSRPIATFAYEHVKVEPHLHWNAPDSPEVRRVTYEDEAQLLAAVQRALDELLGSGGLSPDRVVVLSTRGKAKSAVWKKQRFGAWTLGDFENPGGNVKFSTLQGFKGLEADAVVLCEVQAKTDAHQVYVAASRAKHVLWCVEAAIH